MSNDSRPKASSNSWPASLVVTLALASLATACSQGTAPDEARQSSAASQQAPTKPASPELLRAAASLSLTGVGSLKEGSDYDRAVNCAAALGVLDEVVQLGSLSEAQLRGVEQAAAHFRASARELRQEAEKTPEQFAADVEREEAELTADPGTAGQTALACLRSLAG